MDSQSIQKLLEEGRTQEAQQIILDSLSNVDWEEFINPMIVALNDFGQAMTKLANEMMDIFPDWFKFALVENQKKNKRREMYYRRYARHGK